LLKLDRGDRMNAVRFAQVLRAHLGYSEVADLLLRAAVRDIRMQPSPTAETAGP
jgi:hypothetical protein